MKIADEKLFISIREFLTVYLPKQRCMSPHTIASYRTALNQFLDYLEERKSLPLRKVTSDCFNTAFVTDYLNWLRESRSCSASTRNQRLMALRSFAKYCATMDAGNMTVYANVCRVPFQKAPKKTVDFIEEDAVQALLGQPDMRTKNGLRNGFFMILLYDTAARCQEMLDLRLGDFVTDTPSPYVYLTGKGAKTRAVPLMEKTVAHYQRYLERFHPQHSRKKDDLLFYTTMHGQRQPMSPDTVAYFLNKYAKTACDVNPHVPEGVHPHQFRHTRAIHLYRAGVPLTLVAELLGHSQVSTTSIYAYADTEMKREAILKAQANTLTPEENARWEGNESLIKRLYGLM